MIVIENLKKKFKKDWVLKGVNLTVDKGETKVIIGTSGCGKTVLLKHIIGLLKPDNGKIWVDEEDITTMGFRQLNKIRHKFGMVFQSSALFDSMSVEENLRLALRCVSDISVEEARQHIRRCLALVGLNKVEQLYPTELSGGMKKRVAIARAIVHNPTYILYDEPTTGLDPITADTITQLINRLKEQLGVTSIVVSHDIISTYKIADKVAMLHQGKIHFEGRTEELRQTTDPIVKQFIEARAPKIESVWQLKGERNEVQK